jgi:hypothetical protein
MKISPVNIMFYTLFFLISIKIIIRVKNIVTQRLSLETESYSAMMILHTLSDAAVK